MKNEALRREKITDRRFLNEQNVPHVLWQENGKSLSVTDFSGERIGLPYPAGRGAVSAQGVDMDGPDRRKLEDLSLLEYLREKDLVYMHRLTARFVLSKMRKDTRKSYYTRAAEYFVKVEKKGGKE